jgi:glycosyltransferase involved in cell wall biosynthesis
MSPARPEISVIVRTSGRPRGYLERALGSIAGQSLCPTRVIVSDDAGVEPLAAPAGLRMDWLARNAAAAPNRSGALNRALAQVTTPWLAFLDDDDTWRPDFLERMATAIAPRAADSHYGGVCCRTQALYERESRGQFTELGRELFNPWLVKVTLSGLVRQNLFTNNAVLWHRRVFDEIGGYREDLDVLEDWEFNVRAAARFEFLVVPEVLAHYHRRLQTGVGEGANSSLQAHDRVRARLAAEWRAVGWLPPDRGWHWIGNRWREARHRWARWRFDARWRTAS